MNRRIGLLVAAFAMAAAMMAMDATARDAGTVTRTLQQSVNVPAGGSVTVENLVGHMRVVQGNGPLQIDATVVAGGDQAQALAQSVRFDVSQDHNQVSVHVDYPVAHYDTFLYQPQNAGPYASDEVCIVGKLICFHGTSSSTLSYQGRQVRVNQSAKGGSGAPLYVDVVVHVPANASAKFSNAVGLLEVDGLTNDLNLVAMGGSIRVQNTRGRLDVRSDGGDVYLNDVTSPNARMRSDGGDLTGRHLSGDLHLMASGGDIKLATVAGKLSLSSGGGDVRMDGDLASLRSLNARLGGGDMDVSGDLAGLDSLRAESGGGDIEFHTSNLSMHLDASTGGGSVHVDLPGMRNVDRSPEHLSCDVGKATGTGVLHAGGGDITVTQP
ncbi:MAG TPA: DUF4097 family beta strand repeat-containing protein [Rhodanobacteraceae bacterium]|nr:DUF4097 family beta strand repeat-containing protein [Rhodanobacteraceae bacterium]